MRIINLCLVEWQCDTTIIKTGVEGDNTWVRAGKNVVHQGFDTLDVTLKEAQAVKAP
jgi:hypothetical protein